MSTASALTERCRYVFRDGSRCPGAIEGERTFCFWHDPAANKESLDLKDRLERWARRNRSLEGIILRYAELEGIELGGPEEVDLSNADFFHANLKKAQLTNVNLSDSNLVKVDLTQARMSQVDIRGANLVGLQLRGARVEKVDWGQVILSEEQGEIAASENKRGRALQAYREALSIYQHLGRVYKRNRDREMVSRFFLREMAIERKLMPRWSLGRMGSKAIDLICGYGEKPFRVIGLALLLIVLCSFCYSFYGVLGVDLDLGFKAEASLFENAYDYIACLVYSGTIFVSLGYAGLPYMGVARGIASIEAFVGGLNMAFFLIIAVRKLLR